ncbi:N-acetylmuramic acid 6-phosphate etherase [Imperialibacter roseus]|uniref:N-acetylmuramic acid 6-phosphate etherase n=1 Tax=Imperialibacter roseus TaxID=1324217 RepID=A0ABZ0IQP7_9BACT|nr:N-acetylmuramic acid 6-phosphate etherase [Imperialibacter roseus]WOK06695.1 N-acetylmuramic acid 6-phosphate etherase [Imperialibacter roseus]
MSTTESSSYYNHLEQMSVLELLTNINKEDQTVPLAVQKALPQMEALISQIVPRMKDGGRLFYIGAGTSGRLAIVDASECPPTYGVSPNIVVGIMAGGDKAIRKSVEHAEDDPNQAWKDLGTYKPTSKDTLIGVAASGRTPYVIGGVSEARKNGLLTGCITCNSGTRLAEAVEYPIEAVVGPEFVTGSTRMKSGTAQKLVLNMISTTVMIQLGHVKGNKMVDMQLSNEKLVQRGVRMVMDELKIEEPLASELLQKYGSVRGAVDNYPTHA